MFTTVVTNFQRPNLLRRAISSLVAAHVPNIVISSCGVTQEVEVVHEWAKKTVPGIVILSKREDIDCNECWLSGVMACRTEYVHILHDDDVVAPEFSSVIEHLGGDIDALLMDAFFQTGNPEIPSQPFMPAVFLGVPSGRVAIMDIGSRLMSRGGFSLSPINGVFRKELVVEALEESARVFIGDQWHVRPTMMVGNDLLLWIRVCQKARSIYYENRSLVGYGLHSQSTTVDYMQSGKSYVLTEIYNRVRDYVIKSFPLVEVGENTILNNEEESLENISNEQLDVINRQYQWRTGTPDSKNRVVGSKEHFYGIPDRKVEMAIKYIGLAGKTVVEFGSLEGAHTVSLCRYAKHVISLEANDENISMTRKRCRMYGVVPEIRKMDVEVGSIPSADVFFHSGVLYHLEDPVGHLIKIAGLAKQILLDTHYVEYADSEYKCLVDGQTYRCWIYNETPGSCLGGVGLIARWLLLDDIVRLLKKSFRSVNVVRNEMENYIRATIVASERI